MTEMDRVLAAVRQAIKIERFGYDFYNGMREFVTDVDGQKVVSFLGSLEVDHIKWLEEEYNRQLGKLEDLREEMQVNLSLLGKEKIFFQKEALPELFEDFDAKAALDFAVSLEKRSIEFYEDNLDISEDEETRNLFTRLADFERDHVAILNKNLKSLKEKGAWVLPKGGK